MTDRHKKPGGFRKLVNSLETTAKDRRQQILDTMRKEDPDFVGEVERCIFEFEEFMSISDMVLCELISALPEFRTLAIALFKSDADLIEKFKKNMQRQHLFKFKEETETLANVVVREQTSARFRIVEKARDLQNNGRIVLKKYSSAYPDN